MADQLTVDIEERARAEGFDAIGFASADGSPEQADHLRTYVGNGYHGEMGWMEETLTRRQQPRAMWPGARSAIVLALNYGPEIDPLPRLADKANGVISVYALGHDYHDLVKKKLKRIASWLAQTHQ